MTMAMISQALLSLFLSHLTILTAQPPFTYTYCSFNDTGNYTATSAYHTNLNILLSNLTSNKQIDFGFYNFSYGQNPDRVSAIGLCRGDIKPDDCRGCLKNASILLPRVCPVQKHALAGYDECMLRYSSLPILGMMDDSFSLYVWNLHNVTDVEKHKQAVNNLMERLRKKAAAGDSRRKFAAGNETSLNFQPVYGLVQCTPDLSQQGCSDCLVQAISEIPKCCENRFGGRVIKNSCNIQFEISRFYDPAVEDSQEASSPVSPAPPSSTSKGNSNTSRTIIVIVVPAVAFILLLFLIYIYFGARKSKKAGKIIETKPDGDQITDGGSIQFDFDIIRLATDGFSDENKLGQGGFGPVYKGTLYDGREIAVKRLSMGSGQGNLEFKNEVLLVAKLQHRNLVRLLGFCLEREERLLIYEFLPNKSLDYFIFDPNKHAQLNWEMRYKIIGGIARGLLYLHEDSRLRIIHRDLKASNILLDEELNPKISDFGMARLFVVDQTQSNTNRIVGTYGYMPPEYAINGQFSVKSDVYSFGILVLEILSGEKNSGTFRGQDVLSLPTFVWKNWREGTASNIVDPVLHDGSRNEIMRCIHIGLLCVQEKANRPTMADVVVMLSSYSISLPLPSQPASFADIPKEKAQASVDEATITEPYPR